MKKTITIAAAAIIGGVAAIPLMAPLATADAGTVAVRSKSGGYRHDFAAVGRPGAQRKYTPLSKSRRATGASHQVTFKVLDRHGRPPATDAAPEVYLIPLDGGEWLSVPLENGTATAGLPEGDYIVQAYVDTADDGGARSTSLVYVSRFRAGADDPLVLDARRARPVSAVITDRPGARVLDGTVSVDQEVGGQILTDLGGLRPDHGYITPAEPAPGLRMRMQAQLTENGAESGSPYLYNVAHRFAGIPADPTLRVRTADLAATRTRHTAPGTGTCAGSHHGADFGTGMIFFGYSSVGDLPAVRMEYFSPGFDWFTDEGVTTAGCDWENQPPQTSSRREYFPRAGGFTRVLNAAPFGPAPGFFRWHPGGEPGGEPDIAVPMVSPTGGHGSLALNEPYITGGTTLYDPKGEVIAATNAPGAGSVLNEPRTGRHTLVVEARNRPPWGELSARQRVAWSFDAPVKALEIAELPAVRYATSLDDLNNGRAGAAQPITLSVETWADGETAPANVQALDFSVSTDNGTTWTPVALRRNGERWLATVRNPAGKFVSFRARARTADGTTVDQTVVNAYQVR